MFTAENRVGRLCEFRARSIENDDVVVLATVAGKVAGEISGKVIACSDFRQLSLMRPELASRLILLLARMNPRLERSAVLIRSQQGLVNLQISRIIREAGSSISRVFHTSDEIMAWLGDALTPEEQTRLGNFLAEGG